MKLLMIGFLIVALTLVGTAALAGEPIGTLYQQEGTNDDGVLPPNAAGQGDSCGNWKYQYGNATWFGIYKWGEGWICQQSTGDDNGILIEADIEMFCSNSIQNHKIYFHFGDISNATPADKTAYVQGTMTSNNGQWIGLYMPDKDDNSFEKDANNEFTGRIKDAMVGRIDCGGRDISTEKFDVKITLSWGSGYQPPDSFGPGAHGSYTDVLWWKVNNGVPGSYNLMWKIELEPDILQADGNYEFDPTLVVAPVL